MVTAMAPTVTSTAMVSGTSTTVIGTATVFATGMTVSRIRRIATDDY
jgi:hypothetical protein